MMSFARCTELLMVMVSVCGAVAELCSPTSITFTDWLVAPNSWYTYSGEPDAPGRCLTVLNATLLPPSVQSWGQPDFSTLSPSPVDPGQPLPVILQDTTVQTDCSTVQQYQQYVCSLDTMLLAGFVEISSPYWIYVSLWQSPVVVSKAVNITCIPPAGNATSIPCLATSVSSAGGLLAAVNYLQRVQGPPAQQTVAVLITLEQSIMFTEALVAPYWSFGMPITANVTVAAVANDVVVDWGNLVNVFNILPTAGPFLTLSKVTMINLPVYFAPPASGRYHISGVLQSTLWSINRKSTAPAQLSLVSCISVLAFDSFSLWAYFFSVAGSPDPSVAKLASWTTLRGLNVNSVVGNNLRVTNVVAPTVKWVNMTLANPDYHPIQVNNVGLLTIANGIVPPTAMFQVASLAHIQYAINYTINNEWTAQSGQFIIICRNITGNVTNAPVLPPQANATRTVSPDDSSDFAGTTVLPPAAPPPPTQFTPLSVNLALPAVLQAVTTFTTWPNASACWDFQLQAPLLEHGPQTKVTMQQLSLMNLPPDSGAQAPNTAAYASLVTGFWLFDIKMGDSAVMSSYLTLQDVTLFIPTSELQLYCIAASLQPANASSDAFRRSTSGKQLMAQWITKQQVASHGAHWIVYTTLNTLRFQGSNVNLTDVVPPMCSKFAALPLRVTYDAYTSDPSGPALPGWAIGLIVGLGCVALLAVVGAVLVVRRQRSRHLRLKGDDGDAQPRSSLCHLMGASSQQLGSADPLVLGANPLMLGDTFSNVFKGPMVEGGKAAKASHATPESIFSRLANQNTGLKDEQLQISGVLGRGGHGVVYKGVWKSLPVAVKVMVVHEEEHEKARRQMLEAMLSTSLSHPNIVTTYTYDLKRLTTVGGLTAQGTVLDSSSGNLRREEDFCGATAWQLLIVQELCSGGTIRALIDRHALTVVERSTPGAHVPHVAHVLQLALDVARGLEHLHAKNIVHTDLNPNNVLMQAVTVPRSNGLLWTAKVADFGLSEAFEAGRSHVSQRFAGTPFYIAPETQSAGIVSKQSDVFAYGILLSEMMSGPACGPPQPPAQPLDGSQQQQQQPPLGSLAAHLLPQSPVVTITCDGTSTSTSIGAAITPWSGADVRSPTAHDSDALQCPAPQSRMHSATYTDMQQPSAPQHSLTHASTVLQQPAPHLLVHSAAYSGGANSQARSTAKWSAAAAGCNALTTSLPELELMQRAMCDGSQASQVDRDVGITWHDGFSESGATAVSDAPTCLPRAGVALCPPPSVLFSPFAANPKLTALKLGDDVFRAATPSNNGSLPVSPRLLGGGGGKFGAARLLPFLPTCCPADYAALVAECLEPAAQRRPPIGAVVGRLRALVKEHVSESACLGEESSTLFTSASMLSTLHE